MTPQHVMRLSGSALVVLSAVSFLAVDKFSPTALIPGGFGLAIIGCGLANPVPRLLIYVALILLAIVTLSLTVPFRSAFDDRDLWGMFRVGAMIAIGVAGAVWLVNLDRRPD